MGGLVVELMDGFWRLSCFVQNIEQWVFLVVMRAN